MAKNPILSPYITRITAVNNNVISVERSYEEVLAKLQEVPITADTSRATLAEANFSKWSILFKHKDKRDLSTFLHFGDDKMLLTVNATGDDNLFPNYPHSVVYKCYSKTY